MVVVMCVYVKESLKVSTHILDEEFELLWIPVHQTCGQSMLLGMYY